MAGGAPIDFCSFCDRPSAHAHRQRGQYCSPACRQQDQYLRTLAHKYGITVADYKSLFAKQESRCAICGRDFGSLRAKELTAFVDHDHRTGRVRGLLCRNCNTGLGFLGDDADVLERAISYLRRSARGPAG